MPKCGDFSHMLLDTDEGRFDGMRVIRCIIVALDPKNNTVDVEVGEHPVATVPAGELADTDCPDIPTFEGDGWSVDEERRRFNDVPIYYHCQGSTGTDNELRLGHMAFRVPLVELTSPPYTVGEVAAMHERNLREKVYLVYIPPTSTEAAGGSLGYRYVIGHSDIHDITPCKSEYICFRVHDRFETDDIPTFGHSDPTKTIVAIVDPVGQRIYKGLEPYGITFPCTAQAILDRVAEIELSSETPQIDIDFLDTLHAIAPLYQNAFVFQAPYWYKNVSTYVAYWLDPYGHEYYPTKLHWLTHWFDYGLQCEDFSDKRLLVEPYATCYIWHNYSMDMDGEVPGAAIPETYIAPIPIKQNVDGRDYELLSGGLYRTIFIDMNNLDVGYVPHATVASTVNGNRTHVEFENWIYHPSNEFHATGFYSWGPERTQASFITVSGTNDWEEYQPHDIDYQVKLFAPWQDTEEITAMAAWYEFSHNEATIPIALNSDAIAFGRQGAYAVSAFVHGETGGYTSRAAYAFNQDAYYGDTNLRQVSYFRPLPGASSFLTTLLGQMFAMHEAAGLTGWVSSVTAFVIDVLE